MENVQSQKKVSLQTIITGIIFTALLVFTTVAQPQFKSDIQIIFIIGGIVVLASLFSKAPFKTSIPFYILLGYMVYVSHFIIMQHIVNIINPDDGWIEYDGQRERVMQMNWIYGFLSGFLVAPLSVLFYHKKVKRVTTLEIGLASGFVVSSLIIYVVSL